MLRVCLKPNAVKFLKTAISICLSCIYFLYPNVFTKCLPVLWNALCCNRDEYGKAISLGLIFGACGDFTIDLSFLLGLVFFLFDHLADIHAFFLSNPQPLGFCKIFGALYFIFMMVLILPYVDEALLIWVILYAAVLIYSACVATMRATTGESVSSYSKALACIGAWIFVVSDSMLGVVLFREPGYRGNLVMITYYLAQLLIAMSSYIDTPKSAELVRVQYYAPLLTPDDDGGRDAYSADFGDSRRAVKVVRPVSVSSNPGYWF